MSRAVDVLGWFDGVIEDEATHADTRPHDEAAEARAAVAELIDAVQERRTMSARGRQSTGPFAESDARIDAALARCQPKGAPTMQLSPFQLDQDRKRRDARIWQAGYDSATLECNRRVDRALFVGVAVGSGVGAVMVLLVAGWLL